MKVFAVCLQIDPESNEWGLPTSKVDLKCMWEPHS